MRHLLSTVSRPIVKRLAKERTLCAFDFDGTLSPIVDHPNRARMRVRTRNLLRRLAELYPCVIVSGRARTDVLRKLDGVSVTRVIGNHGAETGTIRKSDHRVERWKEALELELRPLAGVWVEDKGLSLAVHYRRSIQEAEAQRRIRAATQKLKGVRVFGGKKVVNVVLERASHKGDALVSERDRLGCNWVLYVGDDENDEDAFAVGGNIVSVRIGRKQRSHASYYLRTQSEIDELIALLVKLRQHAAPTPQV
jgi:trehalose 6-phosphate phosphatase